MNASKKTKTKTWQLTNQTNPKSSRYQRQSRVEEESRNRCRDGSVRRQGRLRGRSRSRGDSGWRNAWRFLWTVRRPASTNSVQKKEHTDSIQAVGDRYSIFECDSSNPPSQWYLWLKQSLDDSTPLDGTFFLAVVVAAFFLPFLWLYLSHYLYIQWPQKWHRRKRAKAESFFEWLNDKRDEALK